MGAELHRRLANSNQALPAQAACCRSGPFLIRHGLIINIETWINFPTLLKEEHMLGVSLTHTHTNPSVLLKALSSHNIRPPFSLARFSFPPEWRRLMIVINDLMYER